MFHQFIYFAVPITYSLMEFAWYDFVFQFKQKKETHIDRPNFKLFAYNLFCAINWIDLFKAI